MGEYADEMIDRALAEQDRFIDSLFRSSDEPKKKRQPKARDLRRLAGKLENLKRR